MEDRIAAAKERNNLLHHKRDLIDLNKMLADIEPDNADLEKEYRQSMLAIRETQRTAIERWREEVSAFGNSQLSVSPTSRGPHSA